MPFVIKNGNPIWVAEGGTDEVLAEKRDALGQVITRALVPSGELPQREGFVPVDPALIGEKAAQLNREDYFGGFGQGVKTLAEGAVAGLVPGGDFLLNALTDGNTAKRAEINPYLRGTGEVAGAVGGIVAAGGTGALAKGVQAVSPTVKAIQGVTKAAQAIENPLARKVATEAAENALIGVNQQISQFALSQEDKEFSAEAFATNLMKDGLIGAFTGAAGYGLTNKALPAAQKALKRDEAVKATLTRGETKLAPEAADRLREDVADSIRSVGQVAKNAEESVSKGFTPESAQTLAQAYNNGVDAVNRASKFSDAAAEVARASKIRTNLGKVLGENAFDSAGKLDPEAIFKGVDKLEDVRKYVGHMRGTATNAAERAAVEGLSDGLDDAITKITITPGTVSKLGQETAERLKTDWGVESLADVSDRHISKLMKADLPEALAKIKTLDATLRELDTVVKQNDGAGALAGAWGEAQTRLSTVARAPYEGTTSGMTSREVLGALGVKDLPELTPAADDLLHSWLLNKSYSPKAFKKAVVEASGEAAEDVEGGFLGRTVDRATEALDHLTGDAARQAGYRGAYNLTKGKLGGGLLEGAMRRGVAGWLGSQFQLITDFARVASDNQARVSHALANAGEKTIRYAAPVLSRALSQPIMGPREDHKTLRGAYEARAKEVTDLALNQGFRADVNAGLTPIRDLDFTLGDLTEDSIMRTVNYLFKTLPKDPGGVQHMLKSRWRASDSQMHEFGLRYRASLDPVGVIERASTLKATKPEIETVKALHPKMFAYAQQMFMRNIPVLQEKIGYNGALRLGGLFGIPLTSSTEPENAKFYQDMHAASDASSGNQPAGAASPKTNLKAQQEPLTATQKLQDR